jgi:uncharacterized protein (DUF433 family)
MERAINVSEHVYAALQRQAKRSHASPDELAEGWLSQHLDLERFPELDWREGTGGWRAGIKGSAIDVYTVVGYSRAGYTPQQISDELLPSLSQEQVRIALRYYAEYPGEIDEILAGSENKAIREHLRRALGPAGYRQLTGGAESPHALQESNAAYDQDESAGEHD